jgi:hypothetical protein
MSVSVSQSGGGDLAAILAGGKEFTERLERFQQARAHADHARQLRIDAEAMKAEAEQHLAQAKRDAEEAAAKNAEADKRLSDLDEYEAKLDVWLAGYHAMVARDREIMVELGIADA